MIKRWSLPKHKYLSLSIILTLIHSLIWGLIFSIIIFLHPDNLIYILLFIYIFISLSLKDSILFYIHFKITFRNTYTGYTKIINKINAITSLDKLLRLFQIIIKKYHLTDIYIIKFQPDTEVLTISPKKITNWQPLETSFLDDLYTYISLHKEISTIALPVGLKLTLEKMNIDTIVKIIFRDEVIGFIGYLGNINPIYYKIITIIAQKFSLILKNQNLYDEIDTKKIYFQELDVAQKVQKCIEEKEVIIIYNKIFLKKIMASWNTKYFPVCYESCVTSDKTFFLLCRIKDSFHSSSLLQLLTLQGYFLTLSRRIKDIDALILKLNSILLNEYQDTNPIIIDGFLAQITPNFQMELYSFGTNISLYQNNDIATLTPSSMIGSAEWTPTNKQVFMISDKITLSIKDFTLLQINKIYDTN